MRPTVTGLFLSLALASFTAIAATPDHATLRQRAEAEQAPLLDTLRDLVEIESSSFDFEGLSRALDFAAARLASLGGVVERLNAGDEIYRMEDTPEKVGGMLKATFTGTGTKKILLIAHLDTVYPRGTLAKQPFHIEGNRAYGPGIVDDKQGVAVILHAVALLQKFGFRDYGTLTVFLNCDEEISSPVSRFALTRLGSEHDVVLSYEGSRVDSDKISLATSGIAAATLIARGRGAHAGAAPERGVNALYELAHQILQARDLSEPEVGLKVNWTLAQAGIVRNMIPPEATARADIRVLRVEDYDRIERTLRERIQTKLLPQSTVELRFERRRPPLEASPAARALGAHAQTIFREIGRDLVVDDRPEGGGTDAAFAALQAKGPVIERMGLQGFGAHTTDNEYVLIDSISPRLYLSARLIMDIARGDAPAHAAPGVSIK
jgi:glutamate carboxypeptidase